VGPLSIDLCFWSAGAGAPAEMYADACDGDDHRFLTSGEVLAFRAELLDRWISFNDCIEPLEYDPDVEEQANLDRYVLITVPLSLIGELPEVIRLARSYNLSIYDPQVDQVLT
jgi:hypothetical protein